MPNMVIGLTLSVGARSSSFKCQKELGPHPSQCPALIVFACGQRWEDDELCSLCYRDCFASLLVREVEVHSTAVCESNSGRGTVCSSSCISGKSGSVCSRRMKGNLTSCFLPCQVSPEKCGPTARWRTAVGGHTCVRSAFPAVF